MKFTVDNSDLPTGLSRLIDLEAAIRLKQLPGDGKSECHECGDLKHTRPLLGRTETGAAKVEMCRECQAEVVEAELQAHADETPVKDALDAEPTLSDEDLAAMSEEEIVEALEMGDLDPARLEGTPSVMPPVDDGGD